MNDSQFHTHEGAAPASNPQPHTRLHDAGEKGRQLLEALREFLRGREQHQGGMYLPLVRIERND